MQPKNYVQEVIDIDQHEDLVKVNTQYFCKVLPENHPLRPAFEQAHETGNLQSFTPEILDILRQEINQDSSYNKALLLFYMAHRDECDALALPDAAVPCTKKWLSFFRKILRCKKGYHFPPA